VLVVSDYLGTKQLKPYQLGTHCRGGWTYMKLVGGGGRSTFEDEKLGMSGFIIILVRGGMRYVKLAGGVGESDKISWRIMFGFNWSVPYTGTPKWSLLVGGFNINPLH